MNDHRPQSEVNPATRHEVVVIGAGPGGLAIAAILKRLGLEVLIVEQASNVAVSCRNRYDNLHLNTVRWLSNLPGLPISRKAGRWPSRDAFVEYLKDYARHQELPVQLETRVERIEKRNEHWSLETSQGQIAAKQVVVAIGHHSAPNLPDWPGRESFAAEVIHSSDYRSPVPYAGRDVLVIGAGDSGSGIALDLAEHGAGRVRVAVRTPPNIVRGERFGIPAQLLGIATQRLPGRVLDRLSLIAQRVSVGDLSKFGLLPPPTGVYTRVMTHHASPVIDFGFVDAVKKRRIEILPAVNRFDGRDVILDGDVHIQPEAVIAATGFRSSIEPLVDHLNVLCVEGRPILHGPETHPNAPGLYFVGFRLELGGNLRQISIDAKKTARVIARAIKGNRRSSRETQLQAVTE